MMEHDDKFSKIRCTILASTDPNEVTIKEADHLKISIRDGIQQLQTEIGDIEGKLKSKNENKLIRGKAGNKEGKWNSLKVQKNRLQSKLDNLLSNLDLLEDATLELKSSVSKSMVKIKNIKENVRSCIISKENSESSNTTNLIPLNKSDVTVSDLGSEQDDQSGTDDSTFKDGSHNNAAPLSIKPRSHNPSKKARLSLNYEKISDECQDVVQNLANVGVADSEKEQIVNRLSQDELELIFKQSCITTEDLLKFRGMNSTWRDAATSILLIRDSLQVNLELKSIPPSAKNNKRQIKYCRRHAFNIIPLTDLLPIIRASRKFPSTSLGFAHNSAFDSATMPIFHNQTELLQFFTMYGKFIYSVFIGTKISGIELKDLLWHYTPNLKCLSFKSLECISDKIQKKLFSQPTSKMCSSLKVISTGPCSTRIESERCSANLSQLLNVAFNLHSLRNVPLQLLNVLVKKQKVHLIKELHFAHFATNSRLFKITEKLVALAMKTRLSVLNVVCNEVGSQSTINSLLEANKDTLEVFRISGLFRSPIKISILKNLKYFKFSKNMKFEFPEEAFGSELFPYLYKVEDSSSSYWSDRVESKLEQFIHEDGSWTCVPSVKILKLTYTYCPSVPNARFIPRLFPNIQSLTLEIGSRFGIQFPNSVWIICPLAESVEIIVGNTWQQPEAVTMDSFFTGFSKEICSNLQKNNLALKYKEDKTFIQFLRTIPSICDLEYLKFLKVRFLKLSKPFISTVSCLCAFEQMHELKVTFTCDPNVGLSDRKRMKNFLFGLTPIVNVDIDTTLDGIIPDPTSEEDTTE